MSNRISIVKTETWTRLKPIRGKFIPKFSFAFSNCGGKIAFNSRGKTILIDIETREWMTICKINLNHQASGLSFSPCGRFLAFASDDSTIHVIDINLGNTIQIFNGFEKNKVSILFSNSGKYISLSDPKGNTKIYEFFPKFIKNDYNRHLKIIGVQLSPKGTYLLTKSIEKHVLWEIRDFKPKQINTFFGFEINDLYAFSPCEAYLVIRKFPSLQLYDIKRNYWFSPNNIDYHCIYISFSHCEQYLLFLSWNFCEYFRISDMEIARKVEICTPEFQPMGLSECRKFIYWYNTYNNNIVLIWDLEKENCMDRIIVKHNYKWYAFTSLFTQIAILNENSYPKDCVEVWDRKCDKKFILKVKEEIINCCCISPNKKFIVAAYESGVIIIWDIRTESIVEKFRSLLCRCIDTIVVANNSIIIKQNCSVLIFTSKIILND